MAFFRKLRPGAALVGQTRALFDDDYYRRAYRDVSSPGIDRFAPFMDHGWREGRNPSASFNTLYYRNKHLGDLAENPLLHYARAGRAAGLAAMPTDEAEPLAMRRDISAPYFDEPAFASAAAMPASTPSATF